MDQVASVGRQLCLSKTIVPHLQKNILLTIKTVIANMISALNHSQDTPAAQVSRALLLLVAMLRRSARDAGTTARNVILRRLVREADTTARNVSATVRTRVVKAVARDFQPLVHEMLQEADANMHQAKTRPLKPA